MMRRIKKVESRIPFWAFVWICLLSTSAWATGNIDPTNKYAWAENVGWANAASTNGGVTVQFDGISGYLTGLVWGENIGWIKLGDDSGGPYNNISATDWGVNLNASSNLSGYAWGENVGWIKFNPSNSVVTIDMATGRFSGDAWGENIGWVRFKGTAPDYNVRTLSFDKKPLGTPNWWLANYDVAEGYDDGDHVPAWQEYIADTDPTNSASYFHIVAISNIPLATVRFPSSSRRYYTLQWRDSLMVGDWTNVAAQIGFQGDGGVDSLHDTTAATQRFYRVNVMLAP